jgi:hypothetical protein
MEHRTLKNANNCLNTSIYLLLLRGIWWSKFKSIFKCSSFFQHRCQLDICGTLRQLFSCIALVSNICCSICCDSKVVGIIVIFKSPSVVVVVIVGVIVGNVDVMLRADDLCLHRAAEQVESASVVGRYLPEKNRR